MAIEKGLYAAPMGLQDLEGDLEGMEEMEIPEMEIEIVDPESVTLSDGSMEITIMPGTEGDLTEFGSNLAESMSEDDLDELSGELVGQVKSDIEARKDWADTFVKGLDVLGFKYEERTEPWAGACGVNSTVLAEAAIRFQAETMSETMPAAGPVRTKILGEETKEKDEAAARVMADMNYELTENMVEYRPEHERMLYSLGLAGSAFKKVYFDPNLGRQVAIYISAEDVIVPYGASNIEAAERVTHVMRKTKNELKEGDPLTLKRQHFVHYNYVPGFGFYGLGLIHIIGGYARAGTSLIRQLVDAGTLSNLPGGLKSRGLRIKGDDTPIEPGEFKDVDVPSGSIRDNIMPLPYKEPSQTLLALLNQITTEGRRLGAISDMDISDMSANAPVGTTLALLERTLKPMAAVQARVHYAMKQEFKLLKAIMAEYAPEEYAYVPARGEVSAKKADYMMVDVIPVSDPNNSTMAQRVVQYQTVLQMSAQAPQIYDLPQLHRQMIEVLGVKNADKLVPTKDDAKPTDPISENMDALVGKPMKAFIYQDHEAHIATHTSFMQDPMMAQMIGQNPQAKQIMASLQAHIAEHLGFAYRTKIEEKLGVELPAPNEEMTEDMEVQLSRLVADAGKQLTEGNKKQQAQQQAQQQQQDPMMQMKQAELQIKQAEEQRKAANDQADQQIKQAELKLKSQKMMIDAKVASEQINVDKAELAIDAKRQGVRDATAKRVEENKVDLEIAKIMQTTQKPEGKN